MSLCTDPAIAIRQVRSANAECKAERPSTALNCHGTRTCTSFDNLGTPYLLRISAVEHNGVLVRFWLTNMMYSSLAQTTPMVTFDTGILNWTADCYRLRKHLSSNTMRVSHMVSRVLNPEPPLTRTMFPSRKAGVGPLENALFKLHSSLNVLSHIDISAIGNTHIQHHYHGRLLYSSSWRHLAAQAIQGSRS